MRPLTSQTSLGFGAVTFAEKLLGLDLVPWQRWLLIHGLELKPDGSFRFKYLVVLVARQNGKSTVLQILALYFLFILKVGLVLSTAQDLDTAEDLWESAVNYVIEMDLETDRPVRPQLYSQFEVVHRVNGKKALVLTGKRRYKVKAANRRSARGLTGDLILLDELREHQNWDAWGAITKTTMARPNAQVWAFSNAGDITSLVLRYLRQVAHRALGDPDNICTEDPADLLPSDDSVREDAKQWAAKWASVLAAESDIEDAEDAEDDFARWAEELADLKVGADDLGIFEWSAPVGCDLHDPRAWAQSNPSMGYLIGIKTIASASWTDPEEVFRPEVLCQWLGGAAVGPFQFGTYDACADVTDGVPNVGAKILADQRVTACIDVSWDRSSTYIGVAGTRIDGLSQFEIAAARPGQHWVVGWFTDKTKPHRRRWQVAIQVDSPAWPLAAVLRRAGIRVVDWHGRDLGVAWATLHDAIRDGDIKHINQPVVTVAANSAKTRDLESGVRVIDRKRSPVDAAPLVAIEGAVWLLLKGPSAAATPIRPGVTLSGSPGAAKLDTIRTAGF